jgi:hypothetical protein
MIMKLLNIFLFSALLITADKVQAQNNYALSTYIVTIDGTSNLHDWNESVGKVTGKGILNLNAGKAFSIQSFTIIMEVSSINSGEGSTMNNKTYKALKQGQFPEIIFSLSEPIVSIPAGANGYTVITKGTLTIAGVTRSVTLPIKISEDGSRKITIDGLQQVKMTDYGVDPPTALFGVLKTGDIISIDFKTTFLLTS